MQSKIKYILLFMLIFISVAACKPVEELEAPTAAQSDSAEPITLPIYTPTAVSVSAGKASVIGKVNTIYYGEPQPMGETIVRLAKVHWNEDRSDGVFVLEGSASPSTISQPDGTFAFIDINPGEYVLVVGDVLQDHEIIADAEGDATIYPAPEGEVSDLGTVEVYLEK